MKNNKADLEQLQAIERVVRETWMYVEHLNAITKSRPELLIPIARKQIVWPAFISRKRASQKQNAELMDKIQLGDDYVLTGEWQPNSPSTHGALWVHWWGTRMSKEWRLPQLTKKNKRPWFDRTWRCMERHLHITPENDPLLAPLGKSAQRYYKREDPNERMPLALRAEIRRRIWKAFNTLIVPKK